jgi:hypothetical protein
MLEKFERAYSARSGRIFLGSIGRIPFAPVGAAAENAAHHNKVMGE